MALEELVMREFKLAAVVDVAERGNSSALSMTGTWPKNNVKKFR
jgi:hypothetical protein